jgi:Trypsin
LDGFQTEKFHLFFGRYKLNDPSETSYVERTVSAAIIHEDWGKDIHSRDGDIAVLTLSSSVQFTKFIQPACLPVKDANVFNVKGSVVGYGKSELTVLHENIPKFIEIDSVDYYDCLVSNNAFGKLVSRNTFCAGGKGKSPCRGDSGGGYYVLDQNRKKWYAYGIVSAALIKEEQCDPDHYVVFVAVSKYVDWIREKAGLVEKNSGNIYPGTCLHAGQYVNSENECFKLIMQHDGNLVIYRNEDGKPIWDTRPRDGVDRVCMQEDGNFVLYAGNSPTWATNTINRDAAYISMQNDGNLVMYTGKADPAVWATATVTLCSTKAEQNKDKLFGNSCLAAGKRIYSKKGCFYLKLERDGSLKIYRVADNKVIWSTEANDAKKACMLYDGNFGLFNGNALKWESKTSGNHGAYIVMQSDGNLVIYKEDSTILWASHTVTPCVPEGGIE